MRLLITVIALLVLPYTLHAQDEFEVFEASISQMQAALTAGELSSVELVEKYLARIAAYDKQGPKLNSLIRINPEALLRAAELDAERRLSGARGALHGIPVIVKDNYNTTTLPTTGGSVALADFLPNRNATQVDKLIAAGAIILAKANLHEFAYGITSISSLGGQTRNPYDPRRVPGGSSGGTAAAVAASLGAVGMGSDTCGSIRIPSAYNNLVGLRPSKGLSSIYGVMPLSHTQDVAGPLARNAADLAIVLDAVAGFDANDEATSIMQQRSPPEFVNGLDRVLLDGLRIGKLTDYFTSSDGRVSRVIDNALNLLVDAGAEIVEVDIPQLTQMIQASGLIGHEFKTDLNQYLATFSYGTPATLADVVDQGLFHAAVQGALGRSNAGELDTEAYQTAYGRRAALREAIEKIMFEQNLDVIVYPPIGDVQVFTGESQPGNNCSLSANSGLPAISLPAGFTGEGLPVGMELLGRFLADTELVSIAHQFEKIAGNRRPPSTTPALVNGLAPESLSGTGIVKVGDTGVGISLSFDPTTNLLHYQVNNLSVALSDLYAVTLLVDEESIPDLNDPIVESLMGPGTEVTEGEIYSLPDLREGIAANRLYFRVFGRGLPATGTTGLISLN